MATSKLVAIQWDDAQLLVASAQRAGGGLWIDRVELVDLAGNDSNHIGDQLKQLGYTRGDATVVVPRNQVEMRQMDVPPVPEEELPDLVRFQAQSHFASLSEDCAMDFVPVSANGHVETVLATTVSGKVIKQLQSQIEPTGLKLKHVVVRPFSTLELIRSRGDDRANCLVINQFQTEVDLTVAANGFVNIARSIRITPPSDGSGDYPGYAEKIIVQEARRTIAAASNQSAPVEISKIILCGDQRNHGDLAESLQRELNLPIDYFKPFDSVRLRPAAKNSLPDRDGRFAPLLGSLVQTDAKVNNGIDFLNPRQAPQESDVRKRVVLFGGIAALLLLAFVGWFLWTLQSRNSEIAQLQARYNHLLKSNEGMDEVIQEVDVIDDWTRGSIAWSDELREVSERFLYADDARTDIFSGSLQRDKAVITLKGQTLDTSTKAKLVELLEGRPYKVDTKQGDIALDSKTGLKFDYSLTLERDLTQGPLLVDQIREREQNQQVEPPGDPTNQETQSTDGSDDNSSVRQTETSDATTKRAESGERQVNNAG